MKQHRLLLSLIIVNILGALSVMWALLYTPEPANPSQRIGQTTLASHTGTNGTTCWVAVDGTVYSISGFSQWEMGKHTTSNGKASCGRDLSGVIDESPHGRAVLQLLTVVGKLD